MRGVQKWDKNKMAHPTNLMRVPFCNSTVHTGTWLRVARELTNHFNLRSFWSGQGQISLMQHLLRVWLFLALFEPCSTICTCIAASRETYWSLAACRPHVMCTGALSVHAYVIISQEFRIHAAVCKTVQPVWKPVFAVICVPAGFKVITGSYYVVDCYISLWME